MSCSLAEGSNTKKYIVKSGAEEERSKNLQRRLHDRVAPFVQSIDAIQNKGTGAAVKALLYYQFLQGAFTMHAESDFGISFAGAATRVRFWSDRFV